MTEIKLLKHNQDLVNEIETAMVFGYHKIFYTEATGLGKSFIMMYLIHKYFKDKKVLYICPKYQIWTNLKNYAEFKLIEECVDMECYADFNSIKDKHFQYDCIFIDEAHHLDTPIQGQNICTVANTILQNNPNTYIFGFTATPYNDDNEFIGDKYFDKSVIGMDLFKAIDAGILQKIKYAIAVSSKINLSKEEQKLAKKYNVDTTRYTIEELMKQYSDIKHWLVYFHKIDELEENSLYFQKYFPEYKLFKIHSEIDNCDEVISEFEKYEGKALLLTVSMVLEGVHPKTVEGILLYRNVQTDNTFMQIIGRLGIINPNSNPIIIDIYSVYRNFLKSNIVKETNILNNMRMYTRRFRDYALIQTDTLKFIELSNIISNGRYGNIQKTYRGYTYTSYIDLSNQLGKCSSFVSSRIARGYTEEQIIDEYLDSIKSYRGYTYTSHKDLSKQLGYKKSFVSTRIARGYTEEQIIDEHIDKGRPINKRGTTRSYRGYTYTSYKDLNKLLGRYDGYVTDCISRGYTEEQIIDEHIDKGRPINKCSITGSYRGYTYTSYKDLSKQLGKCDCYVSNRVHQGYTVEQIIDKYLDRIKSYRGYTYTSYKDLEIQLGKYQGYISNCLRLGYTVEQIIDKYIDNNDMLKN